MNYLSLNIRGIADPEKFRWVKDIKSHNKINFISFQETKSSNIDDRKVTSFWGNDPLYYDFVSSMGLSGGLLNMWDPTLFTKSSSFKSRYLLLTSGKIKGMDQSLHILNLYAPQDLSAKRTLWNKVIDLKNNNYGIWIIMGDYNAVR